MNTLPTLFVAIALLTLGTSVARAQDIPRTGDLVCRNLDPGVTATATLTWTLQASPIAVYTFNCGDVKAANQPATADGWILEIVINGSSACFDANLFLTAGKPAHISSRCAAAGSG